MNTAPDSFFDAQGRQEPSCLHETASDSRKNMEHEVRNVRVRNRVGVSLLDCLREKRMLHDYVPLVIYCITDFDQTKDAMKRHKR